MPASARLEYRFATRLVAVPAVRRTIALLATQTLDDLHHAVRGRVVEARGDAPPQYPDWDDADAA